MAGTLKTTVRLAGGYQRTSTEILKGMGAKDSFSGKTTNPVYARAAVSRINAEITSLLLENTLENELVRGNKMDQRVMATALKKAAENELKKLIPFISRFLLNIPKTDYEGGFSDANLMHGSTLARGTRRRRIEGDVDWPGLSPVTMKRSKGKTFFKDKGDLARRIRTMATSYPQRLGGVKVTRKDFTKRNKADLARALLKGGARPIILSTLDIQVAPDAPRGLLPGLQTGSWDLIDPRARLEQSGFIADTVVEKKLRGPLGGGQSQYPYRFRPLFGPVTQFWLLHRVPNAMAIAMANTSKARR